MGDTIYYSYDRLNNSTLGLILGGVVGVGTIVCVALVGPVAGIFLPLNERMIEGCMKRIMS